uniref:Interleukin-9 n=1 Tax=Nothoprocta perdicaria TaxID=30464 RepID=A0A8C6Z5M2_NOTPE
MHAGASMLTYVLLSSLLLSVQGHYCQVSEIIPPECGENAGHELSCFVEGTERLMESNGNPKQILRLLNQSFQTQLERKFCGHLSRSNRCQSRDKGNVKEFLTEILKTYQAIKKSKA